jgi:hypothetical protein
MKIPFNFCISGLSTVDMYLRFDLIIL